MEVLYIRHAQAESNLLTPESLVGSNLGLTLEGIRQAEATAAHLASLALKGVIGPIDSVIFSSPYIRARQTAAIISKALQTDVAVDYRLKEISKGDWHGKTVEDVIKLESEVHPDDVPYFRPPHRGKELLGENWFDVADRMLDFIAWAERRGIKSLIVISHNHPIEIAIGKLTGIDFTEWKNRPVDNASINRTSRTDDIWHIDESLYNYKPWMEKAA